MLKGLKVCVVSVCVAGCSSGAATLIQPSNSSSSHQPPPAPSGPTQTSSSTTSDTTPGTGPTLTHDTATSTGPAPSTTESAQSSSDTGPIVSSSDNQTQPTSLESAGSNDDSSSSPGGEPSPTYATSAALLASFDLGWNLGNSLDVPEGETEWGNPAITPELLQTVAQAGFDIVRIPVTWSLFTGPGPEFAIDATRMNRVGDVVQYALDAGLHAIINLHHDGADELEGVEWLTLNNEAGDIDDANNAAVEARFRAVWTQLAQHFESYDERLLFESMNEIHDGYDAPVDGYYSIINRLNQVFVDVVRGSGGGNTSRHLVVPGYNTNIGYTLAGFELPTDPTPNHLILSVHFYDPWPFAGAGESAAWGAGEPGADSWGQEDHVVTQFDQLKSRFIDQGLPMIIGEYGAVAVQGRENYRRYYMEYVTQAACQRGLVPIYWDNGGLGSGADKFGLFDRNTLTLEHSDILDAMSRGCANSTPLDSVARP